MSDRRVWIRERQTKRGRTRYDLRWVDPATGKWKSKSTGGDRRRAEREAATLEGKLADGTHHETERIGWSAFVGELVGSLQGEHAVEARRTLDEFGDVCKPGSVQGVTRSMIRRYVQTLRDTLRRLQAMTLQDGGPFVGMDRPMQRRWTKIVAEAGCSDVTLHDLRRTFVTRLVRAGVPMPYVQELAGHESIGTTRAYYVDVSRDDLRNAIAKLA